MDFRSFLSACSCRIIFDSLQHTLYLFYISHAKDEACSFYMIVRAYPCIVLLVSCFVFWSWVCHGKSLPSFYLFSVFYIHFSCWTFWVVHQTTVHILLFFSFSSLLLFFSFLFGTCIRKYWERLGFGWQYILEAFVCMLLIHIMWVLCFLLHTVYIYTRIFVRIHDLPYYIPALRSIVQYNCNVDPPSTTPNINAIDTIRSWNVIITAPPTRDIIRNT